MKMYQEGRKEGREKVIAGRGKGLREEQGGRGEEGGESRTTKYTRKSTQKSKCCLSVLSSWDFVFQGIQVN